MRARSSLLLLGLALTAGAALADAPASNPVPRELADLDRMLVSLDAEERTLRTELDGIGPRTDDLRKRVIARGRVFYRLVRAGLLPVSGGFDALVAHARRVEQARKGLEQDLGAWRGLNDRKLVISRRLDEITVRRAPLVLQQQAADRARTALQEQADRDGAFQRAFQSSTGPEYLAVYGPGITSPDPNAAVSGGFRAMKGKLAIPVPGRAEIRVVHSGGGPALELHAPPGTPVRAVHPGRVAFADDYATFGRTVLLDHGDHFYTVMGHLASAEVKVGDSVVAGATIGTVGSEGRDGWVYFEVRQGSSTLDPGPWLGIVSR